MTNPGGPVEGFNLGPLQQQVSVFGAGQEEQGAGISALELLEQSYAEDLLKSTYVQGNPSIDGPLELVWGVLRAGISLPLAILEAIANALTGGNGSFLNLEHVLTTLKNWGKQVADAMTKIPVFGPIIELLASLFGIDIGDPGDPDINEIWRRVPIFGTIIDWLIGGLIPVPVGSVTGTQPNLLPAPLFAPGSIADNPRWTVDPAVTRSADGTGSARITLDGTVAALRSGENPGDRIAVAEGQKVSMKVWVKHTAYAGTGSPIQLHAVPFIGDVEQPPYTLDTYAPSGTLDWPGHPLSGVYEVPAGSGVTSIQGRIYVGATATGGVAWFDEGEAKQVGLLQMSWVDGLLGQFNQLFSMFNQIFDVISGLVVTPITDGIAAFAAWVGSLANQFFSMFTNHQGLVDNLLGGLLQSPSTGGGAGDVGNAAADTSLTASTAMQLSEWTNAVQSLRNNKSLMQGIDETEETNFTTETLWPGTSPLATVAATSALVPVAYKRFEEDALKGFISWFGNGAVGELYIDVYEANYDTNTWDGPIYTSPNLSAMVDNTWRYLIHNVADVEDRIGVFSGKTLGVAWRVEGAGTHNIAGIPKYDPPHPTQHPKRVMSRRTGSGQLAFGATAYTLDVVPWFGMGIITGDVPPPFLAPQPQMFTTPGDGFYTIPEAFRVQGNVIDRVACGSGTGGSGSLGWIAGNNGLPGDWAGDSLVYGVDIPLGTETIPFHIAPGGAPGGAAAEAPANGTASTSGGGDIPLLSAAGGVWDGTGNPAQVGPGNYNHPVTGKLYTGGSAPGSSPGAGGAGAIPWQFGGYGGNGMVAFVARQP